MLQDIKSGTGKALKHVDAPEAGASPETFARGALLHEIQGGKALKQVQAPERKSLTFARGGMLNELRRKRSVVDGSRRESRDLGQFGYRSRHANCRRRWDWVRCTMLTMVSGGGSCGGSTTKVRPKGGTGQVRPPWGGGVSKANRRG